MIVVDASAMLELLLVTPRATRLYDRVFAPAETLYAPELLDLEIAQVLRRFCAAGTLGVERASQALGDLADCALIRYPHLPLTTRGWQLRHNITAYDAAYIALAEALGAPLLTTDARLARAPGHGAMIEVL